MRRRKAAGVVLLLQGLSASQIVPHSRFSALFPSAPAFLPPQAVDPAGPAVDPEHHHSPRSIREVNRARGRGASRREADHIAPTGTDRITEITPETSTTGGIRDPLVLQDARTRATGSDDDLATHHQILAARDVNPSDSISIAVFGDETTPTAVNLPVKHNRTISAT